MDRIHEMVSHMDDDALDRLSKDLREGGVYIKELVTKNIHERELERTGACTTCSSDIDPRSSSNYTLLFGPSDLKKRARFCGMDCMEYFIRDLKQLKRTELKEKRITN